MNTTKHYLNYVTPSGHRMFHTLPFGHICHNGMNFRNSVKNHNSRLIRMLTYIESQRQMGNLNVTKIDILRDVFGKVNVCRGWGNYLFSLSLKIGFTKMVRKGNKVFYRITKKGESVIS
jgi:hypothetical protein